MANTGIKPWTLVLSLKSSQFPRITFYRQALLCHGAITKWAAEKQQVTPGKSTICSEGKSISDIQVADGPVSRMLLWCDWGLIQVCRFPVPDRCWPSLKGVPEERVGKGQEHQQGTDTGHREWACLLVISWIQPVPPTTFKLPNLIADCLLWLNGYQTQAFGKWMSVTLTFQTIQILRKKKKLPFIHIQLQFSLFFVISMLCIQCQSSECI